ncbi:MAG TPA: glycosyltransferase family 39 protein [Roseiflexaceae bacterium]|nr:glycosyltransferase family 39 protein [Roseiflexaceae bacterium]
MASVRNSTARVAPAMRAAWFIPLSYVLLAIVALVPRIADLGGFITGDEALFWLNRSNAFLRALAEGNFAATAISTHPGVTTMWLGGAGIRLGEALARAGLVGLDYPTFLTFARLPAALTHTLTLLIGYALLRRLFHPTLALLAALLWACDPFVVAYSRLLHVDALAGSFITVSLLAGLLALRSPRPLRLLLLAGTAAGLAILSKSPALILLPLAVLIAITHAGWPPAGTPLPPFTTRLRQAALGLAIWGTTLALTVFLLWPALWVAPGDAFWQIRAGVEAEGASPHVSGNYFLGREDNTPGPLFYPVALALRLTPISMLGIFLLPRAWRRVTPQQRRTLASLALFAVLFTAALTLFPKKFNRYLEPAFPVIDILAAAGLSAGIAAPTRRISRIAPAVAATAAAINLALWHPYPIAAFNQVLGGSAAGARTFAVGWGEGFEQVAAWLNQQPDITGVVSVSRFPVVQAPYMRRGAAARTPEGTELPPNSGYVVVYITQVQRGLPSPPLDRFYAEGIPLHQVSIHGVPYAWIYQVPPAVAVPRPARFGTAMQLIGADPQPRAAGDPLLLQLVWQPVDPPATDYMLFAHLLAADGRRVAQADLPLPSSSWQPGRVVRSEIGLPLPPDLPAGPYTLYIGLYDPADGRRLPLQTSLPRDDRNGADALPLLDVDLP